jgi:hypothetical protein
MLDQTSPRERRLARERLSAAKRAMAAQLRAAGATYDQIGGAIGVSGGRVGQMLKKADRLASRAQWLNALPARSVLLLRLRGLNDLPEAEAAAKVAKIFTPRDLKAQPNFGRQAFEAIAAWLAAHGLALRDETTTTATKKGAPARKRPSDFNRPLAAGSEVQGRCLLARSAR